MVVGRKSAAGLGTRGRSDQCAEGMVLMVLPCSAVTKQVQEKKSDQLGILPKKANMARDVGVQAGSLSLGEPRLSYFLVFLWGWFWYFVLLVLSWSVLGFFVYF